MAYLPDDVPAPEGDETSAPFWAHCNERRLAFQQCAACLRLVHPPLPVCPACRSVERAWADAPTTARVFSFTWVHTAAHESVKAVLPYNVALVEFPGLPGVRLVTNVVDAKPATLAIGDPLELVWELQGAQWLPRFSKRAPDGRP